MASQDHMMSINTVAARLGLSVHQLRRWELMFGLEIKRGRGQQRQYRPEDLTILERIKELVEQGWPTSQIRPQIEAEGLITPKLIGMPIPPGNPEVVLESLIGMRTFCERRFIEISRQIDELRQLVISLSLKQELSGESDSPWQPVEGGEMEKVEPRPMLPPQEIAIGPDLRVASHEVTPTVIPDFDEAEEILSLGEVTDQNYLTVLGRALDIIGWTDEEADEYSEKTFGVPHWDELGRSQAERLVSHLVALINQGRQPAALPGMVAPPPLPPPPPTPAPTPTPTPTPAPQEMSFHVFTDPAAQPPAAGPAEGYDDFYDDDNEFDTTPGGTADSAAEEKRPDVQYPPPSPPFEPPN